MDPKPPAVGLRHSKTITVVPGLTVPRVSPEFGSFGDMPPVFATAFMVGFIEVTCIEALKPHLSAGQRTVGTHVDVSHTAATPVGMTVTAEVELIAAEGKRLRFAVECRDDIETISSGEHERFIIDAAKFLGRVEAKAKR
jgi:fluoroacetyl-CoA thioesterase